MTAVPYRAVSGFGAVHGFFGRAGGVSEGIHASLNCGPGSDDAPAAVAENRRRAAARLGAKTVVTAYQTHSIVAALVEHVPDGMIAADALVTKTPGCCIGVLAADCVPVLFSGPGSLVGAAHAGWRGSLAGILEATIALLAAEGGPPETLRAAIGPCLRAAHFEVGADLIEAVTGRYPDAARHFATTGAPGKALYDHVGFVSDRLVAAGIRPEAIADVGGDTLGAPTDWFSYRASRHRGDPDYGRNLSAIVAPDD